MTRETVLDTATFAALVAGAFIVRNAIAIIGLASLAFFAFFSV